MGAELDTKLRSLRELRLERDFAKANADDLDKRYRAMQQELYDEMESRGVGTTTIDEIKFVPYQQVYAYVHNREEFLEWAETHDELLTERRERKALLNQLAREALDNGADPPPGVTIDVRDRIGQRAA